MARLALVIAAVVALAGITPASAQQFQHRPGVVMMDIPLSRGADPRYHEQRRRPPYQGRYIYRSDPRFMRGNPAMIHRGRHPGMMQSRMGRSMHMQQGAYVREGGYSRTEMHTGVRRSGGRTHCCADNVPAGWSVVR